LAQEPEYLEIQDLIQKQIHYSLSTLTAGLAGGRIYGTNEIANLPKFLFSPGIQNLQAKFSGIPAIIISAGPSLEEDLPCLKEAEGKILLIATAPVVRILLAMISNPIS